MVEIWQQNSEQPALLATEKQFPCLFCFFSSKIKSECCCNILQYFRETNGKLWSNNGKPSSALGLGIPKTIGIFFYWKWFVLTYSRWYPRKLTPYQPTPNSGLVHPLARRLAVANFPKKLFSSLYNVMAVPICRRNKIHPMLVRLPCRKGWYACLGVTLDEGSLTQPSFPVSMEIFKTISDFKPNVQGWKNVSRIHRTHQCKPSLLDFKLNVQTI